MFGGAGINAIKLTYLCSTNSPDAPEKMLNSIDSIINEPVTVHLGNHPGNNDTLLKREKQLNEGGNPFIDANSWRNFLNGLKEKIKSIIKDNEALEKEISEMIKNRWYTKS